MPYQIVRKAKGWALNGKREVVVEEVDDNEELLVPQNDITFREHNYPSVQSNPDSDPIELEIIYKDNTDDCLTTDTRQVWPYDHTLELISAVEARYDDMLHVNKRKQFWHVISLDLSDKNMNYTDKACQKKWFNLVRTYKITKDKRKKTGKFPTRFSFYDRLNVLLGDLPTDSSSHSIDVAGVLSPTSNDEDEEADQPSTSCNRYVTGKKRKRENLSVDYLKSKKQYYDTKTKELLKRETLRNQYFEQVMSHKQEQLQISRNKLELEERKVIALEKLANSL